MVLQTVLYLGLQCLSDPRWCEDQEEPSQATTTKIPHAKDGAQMSAQIHLFTAI